MTRTGNMMTGYMSCMLCNVHKTSMDKTINIIPLPSYLIISNKNVKMFPVPGCTGTLSIATGYSSVIKSRASNRKSDLLLDN